MGFEEPSHVTYLHHHLLLTLVSEQQFHTLRRVIGCGNNGRALGRVEVMSFL